MLASLSLVPEVDFTSTFYDYVMKLKGLMLPAPIRHPWHLPLYVINIQSPRVSLQYMAKRHVEMDLLIFFLSCIVEVLCAEQDIY